MQQRQRQQEHLRCMRRAAQTGECQCKQTSVSAGNCKPAPIGDCGRNSSGCCQLLAVIAAAFHAATETTKLTGRAHKARTQGQRHKPAAGGAESSCTGSTDDDGESRTCGEVAECERTSSSLCGWSRTSPVIRRCRTASPDSPFDLSLASIEGCEVRVGAARRFV